MVLPDTGGRPPLQLLRGQKVGFAASAGEVDGILCFSCLVRVRQMGCRFVPEWDPFDGRNGCKLLARRRRAESRKIKIIFFDELTTDISVVLITQFLLSNPEYPQS